MANKPNTQAHTHIGHARSLCGLHPAKGQYVILDFQNFFLKPDDGQCKTCLTRLASRGYNIEKLRRNYRSADDKARQLALAA